VGLRGQSKLYVVDQYHHHHHLFLLLLLFFFFFCLRKFTLHLLHRIEDKCIKNALHMSVCKFNNNLALDVYEWVTCHMVQFAPVVCFVLVHVVLICNWRYLSANIGAETCNPCFVMSTVDLIKLVSNVCPYMGTSVCPQKSCFEFNEIWHMCRDRRVIHDGMQYDPIQGQGHEHLKVGNLSIFKNFLPPFTMAAGNWPLELGHNISVWLGRIFDYLS